MALSGNPGGIAGDSASRAGSAFQVPGVYSLSGRIIHTWINSPDGWHSDNSSSSGEMSSSEWSASAGNIPDVQLDEGRFKYVLLRITDSEMKSKVAPSSDALPHIPACCAHPGYHYQLLEQP
jgi:hypothetical protein